MKDFLTVDLGVPEDHIQCLVSTQTLPKPISTASHLAGKFSRYMECWSSLSVNDRIQEGENIIIHFSGHGSSYRCSDYYKTGSVESTGRINAICPVDRGPRDSFYGSIPDISDRELNTILAEISRTKGHHITCILDCCYSSSVTRYPDGQSYRVRSARPLPPVSVEDMFDAAHRRLKGLTNYRRIHDGDWSPDMTSHVILAACEETEHAKEHERENGCNGVFTQALIEALKSDRLKAGSTYHDLIHTLLIPPSMTQVPVVAGRHMNERLWYKV